MPPLYTRTAYGWADKLDVKWGKGSVPVGKSSYTFNANVLYDLNDGVNWFIQGASGNGLKIPTGKVLQVAQRLWRSKSGLIGTDYSAIRVQIPFIFEEGGGKTLASERSKLLLPSAQYLTFDNGVTGLGAWCQSLGDVSPERNGIAPLSWKGVLDFLVPEPFFVDLALTVQGPASFAASGGAGTTTPLNINYPGTFYAEPSFSLLTAAVGGNLTVTITNTTSGETLVFTIPADGSTYAIDSALFQISKAGGVFYDPTGSFPMLYPQALIGVANNAFNITCVGTAGSHTITVNYYTRWMP